MAVSIEENSRGSRWPTLFKGGFRLFFTLAAFQAVAVLTLSLVVFSGSVALPLALDPVTWHVHEMLYGFVGAAIAGFLLTAVPNWTGQRGPKEAQLALMGGAWLAARVVMLLGEALPTWLLVTVDLIFPLLLLAWAGRAIIQSGNRRNLVVVGIILLLCIGSGLSHGDDSRPGQLVGIFAVVLLLSLVGGRIVPAFTGNWLRGRGTPQSPRPFGLLDRLAMLVTVISMVLTLSPWAVPLGGGLMILAGILQGVRWSGWRFQETWTEPIVWVMHVGYAWISIGLILFGLSLVTDQMPVAAGTHALTAGAFGTMILAVMSRASLGHSGRPIKAQRLTVFAYYAVTLGALGRIVAVWFPPLLHPSALIWGAAFVLFLIDFLPILAFKPR